MMDDGCTGIKAGVEVYIRDDCQVWTEGVVQHVANGIYMVKLQTGLEVECKPCDVLLRPAGPLVSVSSLTDLAPIHPASVLACLQERYMGGLYYTGAGSTVVAVNPFCTVTDLYSSDLALAYQSQQQETGPHIYKIGAEAYTRLVRELGKVNQSIIISGESGAGKTVSAKHLVRYMALVSNPAASRHSTSRDSIVGKSMERRILDSNPILEAFGNAVTNRNDNSSRFGKYIHLEFSRAGQIQGASIRTYLLEKTRVVHQSPGESNFHIFYQLMQGISSTKDSKLRELHDQLQGCQFKILPRGKEIEENRSLEVTLEAMDVIGLPPPTQQQVLQVLAAILFLGNVDFSAMDEECSQMLQDNDDKHLDTTFMELEVTEEALNSTAALLGVDPSHLEQAFLYRSIVSGGRTRQSVFVKPVPRHEAYSRRDCLATLLYSRLFEWLVEFINSQLQAEEFDHTIGLLDIYGFEDFAENSLEQLCINYANEKLQQHYVRHFLKDLQTEYEEERISWNFTAFTDNQPCLAILEGQPSVFGLLNEDVHLNRKSNTQTLCERILDLTATGTKYLTKPRKFLTDPGFTIRHFAGSVTYRGEGLTTKNKDNIPHELVAILHSSSNTFIAELFHDFQTEDTKGRKCKTVLGKFKASLDQLMSSLGHSDVHYIRCIKPNSSGQAGVFDRQYVMSQLLAGGIIETVEISQQGFPARMSYSQFLQRYGLIIRNAPSTNQSADEDSRENETLYDPLDMLFKKQLEFPDAPNRTPTPRKRLRRRAGLSSMDHTRRCSAAVMKIQFGTNFSVMKQFGKTKLFLHQEQLEELEARRLEILSEKVDLIQRAWHWYRHRCERSRRQQAATLIQAVWRWYRRKHTRTQAAVCIQKCVRAMLARKLFMKARLQSLRKQKKERSWKPIIDRKRQSPGTQSRSQRSKRRASGVSVSSEGESTLDGSSFETDTSQENSLSQDWQCNTGRLSDTTQTETGDVQATNLSVKKTVIGPLASYRLKAEQRAGVKKPFSEQDSNVGRSLAPPVKRMKTAEGCFTTLEDLNIGDGILTRRRLPKVPIRFHTRPSALKNAHIIHQRELTCGLQDCLPDNQSKAVLHAVSHSDDDLD